jgi:hypothetical protein
MMMFLCIITLFSRHFTNFTVGCDCVVSPVAKLCGIQCSDCYHYVPTGV